MNGHIKLENFAHQSKILFDASNGVTSDAAHMLKALSAQDAIEYVKKYHGTMQTELLRASQAFRAMKKLAGIPEENNHESV